jgi:hypothetical protein
LAPNYKQHILSSAKLRKECYLLPELYVKSIYFNLFWWRGREVHETSWGGGRVIKVWEPLVCVFQEVVTTTAENMSKV